MNMIGSLTPIATLSGSLSSVDITMSGFLSVADKIEGQIDIPDKIGDNFQFYKGSYIIEPKFNNQTLDTKEKIMKKDIQVKPILVSVTSNSAGGNTIYIGGAAING